MCLKTCHFTACFTSLRTSVSVFYLNTARYVVTALLIFTKYLSLYLHMFTCTQRGTHTQAHMYNQHTRGMATTRHRSLVERGRRKTLLETLHTHTQKKNVRKKPIFTNLKTKFEHIELPAKLLDYFLRSNKSNIKQTGDTAQPRSSVLFRKLFLGQATGSQSMRLCRSCIS